MRVRRARTVLAHWHEDRLTFANYFTGVSVGADPATTEILDFFNRWREPAELVSGFSQYSAPSVRAAVRRLLQATLLVREGSPEARRDAEVERVWSRWLPHGAFHFGTKDVPFATGQRSDTVLRTYLRESRQPPFFKRYADAPRLRLRPHGPASGEFLRVLTTRKTHRKFSARRLSLHAVSALLYYTWGVTGYVPSSVLGRLPHKTSPSGGARHPGEVYLLALRVEGLASGLYHYDPRHHALERLRKGEMRSKACRYCAGQEFVKNAGALFLMTAVLPRVMWKYRFARAYRVVLLDAGHLCQTFCLTATWLGLAPFCTAAIGDSLIEKDLGLDGVTEVAVYVAGAGSLPAAP